MLLLVVALFKSGSPAVILGVLAAALGVSIAALSLRSLLRRRPDAAIAYPPPLSKASRARRTTADSSDSSAPRPISRASGRAPLAPGSSLGDVLIRLRADFAADATARHVAFDFRMHGGLEKAPLDVQVLHVVLGHLVENALHHAPGGSLIEIRATPARDGRIARISVSDDGEGVAASARPRLFTAPLVAIDATASGIVRARSLVACREMLERLGGSIDYEPRTPRGSRFVIAMPIDSSLLGARRARPSRGEARRA